MCVSFSVIITVLSLSLIALRNGTGKSSNSISRALIFANPGGKSPLLIILREGLGRVCGGNTNPFLGNLVAMHVFIKGYLLEYAPKKILKGTW